MDKIYQKKLERNLWLCAIIRALVRRVYKPFIVIFAVSFADVSLEEVGIIVAISAFVSLTLEIPSGYFADRLGHKNAILLGSLFILLAPLGYIFTPNFYGILFGVAIFFAGIAFHSGTMRAFIHETLLELGRDYEFAKVMGRVQMWGLLGSVVFVSAVSLTYAVNPLLPFWIAVILQLGGLVAASFLTIPIKTHKDVEELLNPSIFGLLIEIKRRKEFIFFLFLGIVGASYNKVAEFREVYFQDVGVPLWFFGFAFALTALVGALLSFYLHKLEKVPEKLFFVADALFMSTALIIAGLFAHQIIVVSIFILFGGYAGARRVLVDTHVLRYCPTRHLKATYLSTLAFFSSANSIWIALVLGYAVGTFGTQSGYLFFGGGSLMLLSLLYTFAMKNRPYG